MTEHPYSNAFASLRKAMSFGCAAGVLTLALAVTAGPALADEDDSIELRILRQIGIAPPTDAGIDYRERSPLVVPPKVDLPPPAAPSNTTANWPRDPDQRRAKERAANANTRVKSPEEDAKPLLPSQLERGGRVTRRNESFVPGQSDSVVLSPSQLGFKGFGSIGNMFGVKTTETATFTGEPERESLTQPPPGYQTPSAAQAYGTGAPVNAAKPDARPEGTPIAPGKF